MLETINYSLQLIVDRHSCKHHALEILVKQAIKGGVTLVQLREKTASTRDILATGKYLKQLLQQYQIPLIINDRVDLALALDADGVHLGQNDLPYCLARKILGKNKIIGLTVNSINQLNQANKWDVNYLGVGPIFPTSSKSDAPPALGISLLKTMRHLTNHPLIAIGGIDANNLSEVMQTGVDGIAVIAAICASTNPEQSALQLSQGIRQINEIL